MMFDSFVDVLVARGRMKLISGGALGATLIYGQNQHKTADLMAYMALNERGFM